MNQELLVKHLRETARAIEQKEVVLLEWSLDFDHTPEGELTGRSYLHLTFWEKKLAESGLVADMRSLEM